MSPATLNVTGADCGGIAVALMVAIVGILINNANKKVQAEQ